MTNKTYKEMMAQQDEYRKKIMEILVAQPKTLTALAREIEVSHTTLRNFIVQEKGIDFITTIKIKNFIDKHESGKLEKKGNNKK